MGFAEVVSVAAAYLVGTFPTAQLVGRRVGHDPTREGSGNPGASNVYRTAGRGAGFVVLAGDLLKGVVPTLIALLASGRALAGWCWLAAVVGHVVPWVRLRRGGKGVATAGGGAFVLYPWPACAMVVVFGVVVWRTRLAALGSLVITTLLPIIVAVLGRPAREVLITVIVAAVVIARHHRNIRRLLAGTERAIPAH